MPVAVDLPQAHRHRSRRAFDEGPVHVQLDGSDLEQVTFNNTFDGFAMFSPDGKKLVFASNRNDAKAGETNIFIADWKW